MGRHLGSYMNGYMVFESTSRFYDDVNFPYGINRAGLFTRTEVDILHRCGRVLKALYDGSQAPVGEEQERFVQVCLGEATPESNVEKAWLKYLEAIGTKRTPVSLYAEHESASSASESLDDSDLV